MVINTVISQLYHGKKKLIFNEMMMQSTLRLYEFDMYKQYNNIKAPVTVHNYKPNAWVLYAWVIDQSMSHICIKQGISYFPLSLVKCPIFWCENISMSNIENLYLYVLSLMLFYI